jgi:hypothetical protein
MVVQNAMRPKAHKNETTSTRNQFTMKLSLLALLFLRLEASSASPPQRIRSADRDTAKPPARKATASISGVPLGVGPDQDSRQRLLEVGLDYYSMSYGSEPVGSMQLSYDFSMSYPTVVDPSDLETPFSEYLRNHFDSVARCAGVEMDVRGGCVFEHLLDLMLGAEDQTPAGGVRRMLQQEETSDSPCDRPNEAAVNFIVSSMLVGARDKCTAMGVDPENVAWDKATSDLVDIFTSPECWGMSPCNDDEGDDDHGDHHFEDHHNDNKIENINPTVMFKYMNRCSEANLDTDSCLVSKTMNALMGMGGPPPSNESTNPSSTFPPSTAFATTMAPPSRFLQEDCPGAPNISEHDFRIIMGDTRAKCVLSGVSISDQEFETVANGFMAIFNSDSCFQQLCEGPNVMLMEIMFDEIADCAQVKPDMPECLRSGVFEMMLNGGEDGQRKLLHNSSGCQGPSEAEIVIQVSNFLEGAMKKCSELGEPVSHTQLDKATTGLATIFTATHCTGGCDMLPTTTSATTTATTTTATTTATTSAATATTTATSEEDITHTPVDSNEATMPMADDGGVTSGSNELSSTTSISVPENAPADEPTEGTTIHDAYQHVPEGVSRIHRMASLIAAAGGLVTISLLVTGFYRMKNAKGGTQNGIIHRDEKSIDGQSTASHTMDSASSVESVEQGV